MRWHSLKGRALTFAIACFPGMGPATAAPVDEPVEMGSSWAEVVQKVSQDASYRSAFVATYRDGITKANIQNAIATFERTLITPNSRFDKFLRGDANAISASEKAGYATFKQYG